MPRDAFEDEILGIEGLYRVYHKEDESLLIRQFRDNGWWKWTDTLKGRRFGPFSKKFG